MEVDVRGLESSPWQAHGTDAEVGPVGMSRAIGVTTDAGKFGHVLDIGYQRFPDGSVLPVFALITDYKLVAEGATGFLGLSIIQDGRQAAAVALEIDHTQDGACLATSDRTAVAEVLNVLLTGKDLTMQITSTAGVCTGFPVPGESNAMRTFGEVASAVREHETAGNPAAKAAYWKMVQENNDRIFGQLERDGRNRRWLVIAGIIALLAIVGSLFGPF